MYGKILGSQQDTPGMEGTTLYKSFNQAVHRGGHLLLLPGGGVHLPVDYGQAALHAVHRQQGKGGHVFLVEHNCVVNLRETRVRIAGLAQGATTTNRAILRAELPAEVPVFVDKDPGQPLVPRHRLLQEGGKAWINLKYISQRNSLLTQT